MTSLLAGVALLVVGYYALQVFTKADPKQLVAVLIQSGAFIALAGALAALVTGRVGYAIPLGLVGFMLLGRTHPAGVPGVIRALFGGLLRPGGGASGPRVSRVRGAVVEMELNHATGALSGRVLAGPLTGAELDALDIPALLSVRTICDPQSLALLEAYLDRRAPAWRENVKDDAGRGNMGGARAGAGGGAMTKDEAYQILGLEPGAEEAAVRAAHRSLMKKLHPDHGGSSYLAARINQAKDVILSKHG